MGLAMGSSDKTRRFSFCPTGRSGLLPKGRVNTSIDGCTLAGSPFPVRSHLQRRMDISIGLANQLPGVNLAIDEVRNDEVRS